MNITLPKRINYRVRKKYPNVRNLYKPYLSSEWTWDKIFQEIDESKKQSNNFIKYQSDQKIKKVYC